MIMVRKNGRCAMSSVYFQEKIRNLRLSKGTSQEELAMFVGVNKSSISKYERGLQDPSIEIAKKIAEFFGISLEELTNTNYQASGSITKENISELIGYDRGYIKVIKLAKANGISPEELIKMMEFALNFRK